MRSHTVGTFIGIVFMPTRIQILHSILMPIRIRIDIKIMPIRMRILTKVYLCWKIEQHFFTFNHSNASLQSFSTMCHILSILGTQQIEISMKKVKNLYQSRTGRLGEDI